MVIQIQDPNTPKFNIMTGQPTDYGVSLGLTSPITIPKNLNTVSAGLINDNNITTPPIVPVVADPNLTSTVNSVIANQTADEKRQAAIDTQQSDINSKLTDLYKVNTDLGNIGSSVDRTEENNARKLANTYATNLEVMQRDSTKRIEDFKRSFGGTTQGADIIAQRMQREDLSAQADQALLLSAATRNFETLNSISQQQMDNNLAVLKAKSENLKAYIEINKADMDKKDQRLYDEQQKKLDADIKRQEENEKTIRDVKIKLAEKGNLTQDMLSKLSKVDTTKDNAFDKVMEVVAKDLATPKAVEAPTIKTINGVDMQWDAASGKWITPLQAANADINQKQKAADQITFLRNTAAEALKLAKASGVSGFKKKLGDIFVGDTKFRQLEGFTNTLKTNMLTLATDPSIKKFFGPQMSNADVLLMTSAGTTLNPEANSPEQMRDEIVRLDELFNRMQTAVKNGGATPGAPITAPDGTQVIITD